jgi:predicted nucleic-acid-binding protein
VLLRFVLRDDAEQSAMARRAIEALTPREPGFLSIVVLCEFAWVLSRTHGQSRAQIAATLGALLTTPSLEVEQSEVVHAALDQFRETSADFADCCIADLATVAGCIHTVTFDLKRLSCRGCGCCAESVQDIADLGYDACEMKVRRQECEIVLEARGPGESGPKPWTHATMPFDAAEAFGSRARIAVKGRINGFPFRSSIMPRGDGTHYMAINKTMLAGAKAKQGDRAKLIIEPDQQEREVVVPPELERAFEASPTAAKAYHAMSYSHRKEYADWIASAQKQETRDTRAEKATQMLLAGKRGLVFSS